MVHVTANVMVSLDGYAAGPDHTQTLENPFGDCDFEMFARWRFADAEANAAEIESAVGADAYVMGRNMFTPRRGEHDPEWTGWWGDEPPYHAPVFVLTHHAHDPIEMDGGTTFYFVDGFDAALEQARAVAGDLPIDVAGGASAVRQALQARVLDELVLDVAPVLLGSGERIFEGVGAPVLEPVEVDHSPRATHVRYRVTYPS